MTWRLKQAQTIMNKYKQEFTITEEEVIGNFNRFVDERMEEEAEYIASNEKFPPDRKESSKT